MNLATVLQQASLETNPESISTDNVESVELLDDLSSNEDSSEETQEINNNNFLPVLAEKTFIKSFIEKENIDIQNYTLDYTGSISNNYVKKINEEVILSAKQYNKVFFNRYYDKLDIDFDLFLNKSNNFEKIDDFIIDKVFTNDKIFNNLNDGATSLFETYKSFSLYKEIKSLVNQENYSSQLLGQITENVVDNIKNETLESKNISEFIFPQNKSVVLNNRIINKDSLKSILFFNINEESFSFSINSSLNATNIIIQSFLNVARSLYTLHPGSLNIYMSSNSKVFNSDSINLFNDKIVSNEYLNLDFYKYINEKEGYFNSVLFLKENNNIGNGYTINLQTDNILLQNAIDNVNPTIRIRTGNDDNPGEDRFLKIFATEDNGEFLPRFQVLSVTSGNIAAQSVDGESVLQQISNQTFGNENFPGQFYYPRSFTQYLTRQFYGGNKSKEMIHDLRFNTDIGNDTIVPLYDAANRYAISSDGPFKAFINIAEGLAYEADFTNDTDFFRFLSRDILLESPEKEKSVFSYFVTFENTTGRGSNDINIGIPFPSENFKPLYGDGSINREFSQIIPLPGGGFGETNALSNDDIDAIKSIELAALIYSRGGERSINNDIDPIVSPVYVDNEPSVYYDISQSQFKLSKSFAVDCKSSVANVLRDPIKTSLEVDSIVKSLKYKSIKTKKFESLIEKVKSNINKNIHLPYCENDNENVSIIDEKNDIYEILFTKDDQDNVYSNIDLFLNKKINSKNYNSLIELKSKDLFESIDTNDLKDFIKKYYIKSTFNNSSSLYLNLVKSISREANSFFKNTVTLDSRENISREMQNNLTLQSLYFNFIYNNKEDKAIDTICKRFIKNAILNSNFSDSSISQNEFKYDFKSFPEEDYDITIESSMKQYIDDVLGSSQSLEIIRKSVFSNKNVSKLAKTNCNYSVINDIDFDNEEISLLENKMIFPFIFVLKNYKIREDTAQKNIKKLTDITTSALTKNTVQKLTKIANASVINPFTGRELEEGQTEYFKIAGNAKNTESDKIRLEVGFRSKNYSDPGFQGLAGTFFNIGVIGDIFSSLFSERSNDNLSKSYEIIDDFDLVCQDNKYVFSNIVSLIRDILQNFYELSFLKSEKEIDKFIEDSDGLINTVKNILYLYSELYLIYFARLQRNIALNNFSIINKDVSNNLASQLVAFKDFTFQNREIIYDCHFFLDRLFSESNPSYFDDTPEISNNILESIYAKDIIGDFDMLISQINNNLESFYLNRKIIHDSKNIENEWKSEVTEVLYDIFTTLVTSDVYQAVSIDLIGMLINYLTKIENKTYKDISSNELINELLPILGTESIDSIKKQVFNPVFVNTLAKKSVNLMEKNISLYNDLDINANLSESLIQRYNNTKIYNYLDQKANKNIEKIDYNFSDMFLENNIRHISSKENFWNSDFHTFNLKINNLFNIKVTSLINITVNFIDHENLNRIYLPKSYIFTPLMTFNNYNCEEDFVFYNPFSTSLYDRVLKGRFLDIANDQLDFAFFKEIIQNKFPLLCEENINFSNDLFLHIVNCHSTSGQINLANNYINGLSLDFKKSNNSETTQEIIDLMTLSLDELTFFNTFNIKKEEAINMSIKNEENSYNLPSIFKSFKEGTTFFENAKSLDDILGNKELSNINNTIYDTYSIHVNPKDFVYFKLYPAGNRDLDLVIDDISESDKSLLKIINFDTNFLLNKTLYSGVDIQNDNYSIEISYKVI